MKRLRRVWRKLVAPLVSKTTYYALVVDDVPERLLPGVVYVVGAPQTPWCAALVCPCGCGELIQLSLIENDSPSWRLEIDRKKRVTLFPSVARTRGCRSHFCLQRSTVVWAEWS